MTDTAHATDTTNQLTEIRTRLEQLVRVRTANGFTDAEEAEYDRLVEAEARLL